MKNPFKNIFRDRFAEQVEEEMDAALNEVRDKHPANLHPRLAQPQQAAQKVPKPRKAKPKRR